MAIPTYSCTRVSKNWFFVLGQLFTVACIDRLRSIVFLAELDLA